jgi:hypothetical protein
MDEGKKRRTRRKFTDDFKAGAVRLVLDEGQPIAKVARDLDLTESAFRGWVEHASALTAAYRSRRRATKRLAVRIGVGSIAKDEDCAPIHGFETASGRPNRAIEDATWASAVVATAMAADSRFAAA